jgi:hypothetical protein
MSVSSSVTDIEMASWAEKADLHSPTPSKSVAKTLTRLEDEGAMKVSSRNLDTLARLLLKRADADDRQHTAINVTSTPWK